MFGCLWKGFKIGFWGFIILVIIRAIMMAINNNDKSSDSKKIEIDAEELILEVENKMNEFDSYNIKLKTISEQSISGILIELKVNIIHDLCIDGVKFQDAYSLNGTRELNEETIELNEIKIGNEAYQSIDNSPYITYDTNTEVDNLISTSVGFNESAITTVLEAVKETDTTVSVFETDDTYIIKGKNEKGKIRKLFSEQWNNVNYMLPSGEEVLLEDDDTNIKVEDTYWKLEVNKETKIIKSYNTITNITAYISDYTFRTKYDRTEYFSKYNEVREIKHPEM